MGRFGDSPNGHARNGNGRPERPTISLAQYLEIGRRFQFSPQQVLIARMIREEHLDNEAIGMRLRAMMPPEKAEGGGPKTPEEERRMARRNVETQIARMCRKLNDPALRGDGPEVRSRTGLLDRIWVEYWRIRAE